MDMSNILFDAPIPGQSLTQDPEQPLPFERPPEFTNYEQAQEYLFELITDMGDEVVELLAAGIPVSLLATQFCTMGAMQGKWNPDLMLLLIEPAAYIVLYLAELAGVEYVLEFDETRESMSPSLKMRAENHLASSIKKAIGNVEEKIESGGSAADVLPPSLLGRMEENQDGV